MVKISAPGDTIWGKPPMHLHPTLQQRNSEKHRLISCIIRTKVECSLILYRGQKLLMTKGKEHHNQSAPCRGESKRVVWELGSWGTADAPWAVRTPLDRIMSSEGKWFHVTLKGIKTSVHTFMVQQESSEVPPALQRCKGQEGEKRWFIAVSLLFPLNTKHPHNYSKTMTHQGG